MFRKLGAQAAVLLPALLLGGCPKPATGPDQGLPNKSSDGTDQPEIPVEIEVEKREPSAGHDPSAASPLLDIMGK